MSRKLIATVGDTHTCPMFTGLTPHIGGTIITGSFTVLANNRQVARMGDKCLCTGCGMTATIIQGDANVLVDGKPVAFVGCMTSHGGVITSGQPNAFLSGSKPVKLATMSINEIDFPSIKYRDRVIAALKGQSKNLQTAENNIKKIKEQAPKEEKKEKVLPRIKGHLIFSHGYLSSPKTNIESHINAIFGFNPDNSWTNIFLRGENATEWKHTSGEDIYTSEEYEKDKNRSGFGRAISQLFRFKGINPFNPLSYTNFNKFAGYWNQLENDKKAIDIYAEYFNAKGRCHFINGSHGLESNGAHRVDHGIALGYVWAMNQWGIIKKDKSEDPELEQNSPIYKPVTIIGHSQGCCPAAGVKLGILKYAHELGWKKAAINIIFLGVHQPRGLFGKEYHKHRDIKVNQYEVNKNVFLLGDEKERAGVKLLNSLSGIFKYTDKKEKKASKNKIYNERGLYEHVKNICKNKNWVPFKSRAIQFSFANDRGDLVSIDGNIPEIKSACNPQPNNSTLGAEYFHTYSEIPNEYITKRNVIDLEKLNLPLDFNNTDEFDEINESPKGYIVLPKYTLDNRYGAKEEIEKLNEKIEKLEHKLLDTDISQHKRNRLEKKKEKIEKELEYLSTWGGCWLVYVRWGIAMYHYRVAKEEYFKFTGIKISAEKHFRNTLWADGGTLRRCMVKISIYKKLKEQYKEKVIEKPIFDVIPFSDELVCFPKHLNWKLVNRLNSKEKYEIILYNLMLTRYEVMLLNYSAYQVSDLYSHFAPVSYINNKEILKDGRNQFNSDDYGDESIFDRIKNAGKDVFYRAPKKKSKKNKDTKENNSDEEQKKRLKEEAKEDKKYTQQKGKKLLIDTSIANSSYINNVINVYVKKNKNDLYKEHKN